MLASTVEATPLTADVDEEVDLTNQEGAIRFALTSEAGLDDGLAFPFTFLAVVMAGATLATSPEPWLSQWFVYYVRYKILIDVVAGMVIGYVIAPTVFGWVSTTELARVMEGAEALGGTLLAYAVTELPPSLPSNDPSSCPVRARLPRPPGLKPTVTVVRRSYSRTGPSYKK